MNYETFKTNVLQWAAARNILQGSTWQKQLEKWGEEYAEMLHAQTEEELMDAIGDQAVCLTIVDAMYTDDRPYINSDCLYNIAYNIADRYWEGAIECLERVAEYNNVSFEACLAQAWDAIKDRKGTMINCKFVKEEV